MKRIFRLILMLCLGTVATAQRTATVVSCKPGTGVRLYKHFLSVRAYHRLACGSTVEIISASDTVAHVRQGRFEGYIQPWHLTGASASGYITSALMQAVANGLYAYGRAIQDPRITLAQDCIQTPGCTLQLGIGSNWQTIQQVPAVIDQDQPMRVNVEGQNYNVLTPPFPTSWAIPRPTNQPSTAPSRPIQPDVVLQGDTTSLMIVNGYAYRVEQDGKWHPLGLGPELP